MVKDPVCSMDVNPQSAEFASTFQGKSYYFCCEMCKQKFENDPKKYITK
ncbi:MAG: YHS domain-containing protein [Candidatus Ranarchaeia archaeon]